jgi:hypothetical protein
MSSATGKKRTSPCDSIESAWDYLLQNRHFTNYFSGGVVPQARFRKAKARQAGATRLDTTPLSKLQSTAYVILWIPYSKTVGSKSGRYSTLYIAPLHLKCSRAMLRRMDDRIRSLCKELVAGGMDEPQQIQKVRELRRELQRYIEHMRARVSEYSIVVERRGTTVDIPPPAQIAEVLDGVETLAGEPTPDTINPQSKNPTQ